MSKNAFPEEKEMEYRSYTKKHRSGAFTLAEFLVVIAITLILAGVSFVAAIRYQSSLRRMEMDRTAKEIFLAAQNNLSLAKSGGVMERLLHQYDGNDTESKNAASETESNASTDKIGIALTAITGSTGADAADLYCILYQPGEGAGNTTEGIRERLLPFGSIDETVRTDGSYLIVYAPGTGAVREVWYSDRYIFQGTAAEFSELSGLTGDPKKRERFYGEAVGYYAGASLTEPEKKDPEQVEMKVTVHNEEVLYVEIETPSGANELKLWVEGAASGAKGWIDLNSFTQDERVLMKGAGSVCDVILDDISIQGARFADLRGDMRSDHGGNDIALIPGEDIRIYAEAVTESGNTSASPVCQTNSLFQKVANGKIVVSNIRHLENLDRRVSDFHPAANEQKLGLNSPAEQPGAYVVSQSEDMSWRDYRNAVVREIHSSHASAIQEPDSIPVYYKIYKKQGEVLTEEWTGTAPGCYAPLEPEFDLVYEGNGKKISELVVNTPGAGGCFGTVSKNLTVTDLELVHPVITAADNAGGLVGCGRKETDAPSLEISVENVLVQYPVITSKGGGTVLEPADAGALVGAFRGTALTVKSVMAANTYRSGVTEPSSVDQTRPDQAEAFKIEAKAGAAGGLIGSATGNVTLSGCAASVYVKAQSFAGGLAAKVNTPNNGVAQVLIQNCYVAGHTGNQECLTELYPGTEGFNTAKGRYNIVSTRGLAGGLAAVLPEGSAVKRSYVTASVWSGGMYAPDEADVTAFVTKYGNMSMDDGVAGKKASDFSYCYTSSVVSGGENAGTVKGKQILEYSNPDQLENYFAENASFSKKQAFPYDTTQESTYPMPTVLQLMQEDPETSSAIRNDTGEGSIRTRQVFKFARVHVGDWFKVQAQPSGELKVHNGNELWVDYVTDMPAGTEPKYLIFSVYGESSGLSTYVILKIGENPDDFKYYGNSNPSEILELRENPDNSAIKWKWDYKGSVPGGDHRFAISKAGASQLQVRFVLDSKEFLQMGYQNLRNGFWAGEDATVTVSEANVIPAPSDPGSITVNSYFGELHKHTAEVFSARHLINLSFYNREQFQITTVEQTDNILWRKDEDPDAPVLAETAPYCDELEERYPGEPVQVFHDYDSQGYTEAGSFKCIENPDLTLYNGNHHTIAGLNIGIQKHYKQQWGNASAFILSNTHLKVQDLNMKNLQVKGNGTAAGILAFAKGNSAKDTYVRLENIRIYGDDMCITATNGDNGDVGGAVASADVEELELDHVYVYGKNALINKIYEYNGKTVGGLIGHARIGKSMKIRQSVFSGFLDGRYVSDATGGLIAHLEIAYGPDQKAEAEITECYVAGRNQSYASAAEADPLTGGASITGQRPVGGLVGWLQGPVAISNSFSTASIYDIGKGWKGGVGGLVGKADKDSDVQLTDCYFAGKLLGVSENSDGNKSAGTLPGASDNDGPVITYPCDPALQGRTYPYKLWTTENGVKTYRGDWIQ